MKQNSIVFTILAKNYLALAKTLGDSLKEHNPEFDFLIILADEIDDESKCINDEVYDIIEAKNLNIPNFYDLAFKYDLSELSTTIKPVGFEYCFNELCYEKVYYFDPDIQIFDSLNILDENLDKYSFLLTPHFNNLENEWTGAVPENNFLVSGVFNLGFIGIRNNKEGAIFVEWWKQKLFKKGYIERSEGLFYDQNWTQFLITSFSDKVKVFHHFGFNVAWWNLHERSLKLKNKKYSVINNETKEEFPLIFLHFSGYEIGNNKTFNRRYSKNPFFNLDKDENLKKIFVDYSDLVLKNNHDIFRKFKYKYSSFSNGIIVLNFYRRLYRQIILDSLENKNLDSVQRQIHKTLVSKDFNFGDAFNVDGNSFFNYLRKNKLLLSCDMNTIDSINPDKDSSKFEKKIIIMLKLLRFFKNIVGLKNYLLIMKFISVYSRSEYQTFLLKDLKLNDLLEKS